MHLSTSRHLLTLPPAALCRICEPIAFMSIFPYVYYMIESFNITSKQSQIAVYAGLVTSSFAFAEFSTGVLWGRLSDKIGRKPVLLGGLAGTAISMLMFGFATNLPMALIARALGGLLNGNIGVLQTTVAELITNKKEHQREWLWRCSGDQKLRKHSSSVLYHAFRLGLRVSTPDFARSTGIY